MNRFPIEPADWHSVNDLLDDLLDLPEPQRQSVLEAFEASHEHLRPILSRLLERAARLETRDLLEPVVLSGGPAAADGVGPYRLLRQLGAGGMGVVWLAERTDQMTRRQVALKLPRVELADRQLGERIAREREILAALEHPNIARLYDAGVTDAGQPYLALEFVEGQPIDRYCGTHELGIPARLALFCQAARAVAHAHGQLIVHRDLKPANILVTADGQVKLLDFGIAKLLGSGTAGDSGLTQILGRAFTPDYASPEQIEGRAISIASDVYSLGVLLYELLTGRRPYRLPRASPAALEQAILDADPRRPSDVVRQPAVRKALRGDLDTITLKALQKRPEHRYPTVNELVADLERHEAGLPVLAVPESELYRLRKFVSRHRLPLAAASTAMLLILSGAAAALWQAAVAIRARERADQVKEFIVDVLQKPDPRLSGGEEYSATDLLHLAQQRLGDTPISDPAVRVELTNLIANSFLNMMDIDAAEQSNDAGLADARSSLGPAHPLTLDARLVRVKILQFRGRTGQMRAELDELITLLRNRTDAQQRLITALQYLANLNLDDGMPEAAVVAAEEAARRSIAVHGIRHDETVRNHLVLGLAQSYARRADEAVTASGQAMRYALDLKAGNHRDPLVIETLITHANALSLAGHDAEALPFFDTAIDNAAAVFGEDNMMLAYFRQNRLYSRLAVGRIAEATEDSREVIAIVEPAVDRESYTYLAARNAEAQCLLAANDFAGALPVLAYVRSGWARAADAEKLAKADLDIALALAQVGRLADARQALGAARGAGVDMHRVHYVDGLLDRLEGDLAGAREAQTLALAIPDQIRGTRRMRAEVLHETALIDLIAGDGAATASLLEEALTLLDEMQQTMTPMRANLLTTAGRVALLQGDLVAADAALREAHTFWSSYAADHRAAGLAGYWRGRALLQAGQLEAAQALWADAARILVESPFAADRALLDEAGVAYPLEGSTGIHPDTDARSG